MQNTRKVTDDIVWVGCNDRRLTLFENLFPIPRGVSYNSYLVMDEKVTLLDTVDVCALQQFMENIDYVLDGKEIDYLIVQHMEPDHGAGIQEMMRRFPNMKIVANAKTIQMIGQFFDLPQEDRVVLVKEGDTLTTGTHTFRFVMAPMVHWPEVMVTYESTDKILFSADGFGKFGALDADEDWSCEARRYYFNIVGKYGAQVQALLKKAATLDIQTICPLHGPILNENLGYYIEKYQVWSSYEAEDDGVLVAYASIHGNTAKAAKKMKEILEAKGAKKVAITDLSRDDMSEAVEDAFRYSKLIVAASTYDAGVFPCMEEFLLHLKAKNYQKRTVGVIENGTWAPAAAKCMKAILETMKNVTICENTVSIKSVMKEDTVEAMNVLAEEILA